MGKTVIARTATAMGHHQGMDYPASGRPDPPLPQLAPARRPRPEGGSPVAGASMPAVRRCPAAASARGETDGPAPGNVKDPCARCDPGGASSQATARAAGKRLQDLPS